jgi:Tfp pilus assembly protein PilO
MPHEATGWRSSKEESNDRVGAEMKSRTVTISILVAVLIVGVWWMFLFSPVRGDAGKVDDEIETAKSETRALETQAKQLEDLERRAPEIEANLDRLREAVPAEPELASFIDLANQLGVDTGVRWVSVAPAEPATTGQAGTIQLTIEVEGGYFQVLDYLNRLENLPRLVVVDQLSLSASESDEEGASAGAPQLLASLTARMFSEGLSAPVESGGTTTPTSVAGRGGVSSTPQGQES